MSEPASNARTPTSAPTRIDVAATGGPTRNGAAPTGLVVFDFDNTLVHSRIDFQGIRTELIGLLRRFGRPDIDEEAVRRLSIGQIIEAGEAHDPAYGPDAWQVVLEYERAGMLAATIEPGAGESLAALRAAGFRLAVLTNNAGPATFAALEKFALRDAFDLVLTRDDVPMKPDPTGVLRARAELAPDGMRTVVVGDSWLDGAAAQRAGVPFVAFQPRPGVLEERGVPVWTVVERLDQLPALLAGPWPDIAERPAG